MESLSDDDVLSLSLRKSGMPRRMDSKSFRPPPEAQESTNEQPPYEDVQAIISSHIL